MLAWGCCTINAPSYRMIGPISPNACGDLRRIKISTRCCQRHHDSCLLRGLHCCQRIRRNLSFWIEQGSIYINDQQLKAWCCVFFFHTTFLSTIQLWMLSLVMKMRRAILLVACSWSEVISIICIVVNECKQLPHNVLDNLPPLLLQSLHDICKKNVLEMPAPNVNRTGVTGMSFSRRND